MPASRVPSTWGPPSSWDPCKGCLNRNGQKVETENFDFRGKRYERVSVVVDCEVKKRVRLRGPVSQRTQCRAYRAEVGA